MFFIDNLEPFRVDGHPDAGSWIIRPVVEDAEPIPVFWDVDGFNNV